MFTNVCALILSVTISASLQAEVWIGESTAPANTGKTVAGCLAPATALDLDINNVRALIQTGGDMWWDLQQTPKYEVPQGSKKNSLVCRFIMVRRT